MTDLALIFSLAFASCSYFLILSNRRMRTVRRQVIASLASSFVFFLLAGFWPAPEIGLTGVYERSWPYLRAVWRDESGPPVLLTDADQRVSSLFPHGLTATNRIFFMVDRETKSWTDVRAAIAAQPGGQVIAGLVRRANKKVQFALPRNWVDESTAASREEAVMNSLGLPARGAPVWLSGWAANSGLKTGAVVYEINGVPAEKAAAWKAPRDFDVPIRVVYRPNPRAANVEATFAHGPEQRKNWRVAFPPALTINTRYGYWLPLDALASLSAAVVRVTGVGGTGWSLTVRHVRSLPHRWYQVGSSQWLTLGFWLYKTGVAFAFLAVVIGGFSLASRWEPLAPARNYRSAILFLGLFILIWRDFYLIAYV